VLLHGNSIANKRAAMLAAQCAAATASSSSASSLPPPPATAASAASSTAAKPVTVFGAAADEMTDSCRYDPPVPAFVTRLSRGCHVYRTFVKRLSLGCRVCHSHFRRCNSDASHRRLATPPQRAATRLSINDVPSALWARRSAQPLHRVLLSQRFTNIAPGEAVVMLPLPADTAADVPMADAPTGCACAADPGLLASPAAAAPPAPALPEPAKPGLRRRPHFLDAAVAAAALPALADAPESESDAATSAPPCKSTTTTSGRKRARDADAAAASAAQAGCSADASGADAVPAGAVVAMDADAPADVSAAVHMGPRPFGAWWRCSSLAAALAQPPWLLDVTNRALA
jgi:hypothetical protein